MKRDEIFNDVMETLYVLSRKLHTYETTPRKYGTDEELYMVEVHTIDLVGNYKKINVTEIANLTQRTKGAVSQMIDKLIKKGMVVKNKNPESNREVIIELTDKGKIVYDFHKRLDHKNYGEYLNSLNDFEIDDFKKMIKLMNAIEVKE